MYNVYGVVSRRLTSISGLVSHYPYPRNHQFCAAHRICYQQHWSIDYTKAMNQCRVQSAILTHITIVFIRVIACRYKWEDKAIEYFST